MGDSAVGRGGESYFEQATRVASHLDRVMTGVFVEHALDFGCGWGRLSESLARRCGHLWMADLFDDWLDRAVSRVPNATAVRLVDQRVKVDPESMNAVFDIMTVQSISNDTLAREAMRDIRRISAPGAKVISLHIKKPRMPTRTAAQRAAHMGLSKWTETVVTNIDRAGDEYSLVVGTRV